MTPPLRLPSRSREGDMVEVWLRLPDGQSLDAHFDSERNQAVLDYPNGTIAERVEFRVWTDANARRQRQVVDVRGTVITPEGQRFHVLRPTAPKPDATLIGFEWPRDDPEAGRRATEQLAALVIAHSDDPVVGARAAAKVTSANDCAACHSYGRKDNTISNEFGLVNRGTDSAGFFVPETVFAGRARVETYFPIDKNFDDPLVTFSCRSANIGLEHDGTRAPSCVDGSVPLGTLDVAQGLRVGDERTQGLCAARSYLYARMTERARELFRGAFEVCRITGAAHANAEAPSAAEPYALHPTPLQPEGPRTRVAGHPQAEAL